MAKRVIRYWDAGPFLAILKDESWRVQECQAVIKAAESGRVLIATSAISLVEVVKLDQRHAPIEVPESNAQKITEFFKHSWISVRLVDPDIAARARGFIWKYGLSTRDAIHLATADRWRIPQLDTYDGDLLALDGLVGDPAIRITKPDEVLQLELDDELEEAAAGDGLDE